MANKANMAATGTSVEKQVQTALVASTAAPVNRTYKSTLFIMLFQDKNNLLELYNAVSGNIILIRDSWRSTPWRTQST